MELTGLGLASVLAAFAAFGTAIVLLYLLKQRRRAIEVPFVRLWQSVLAEEHTTRLFSTLKRLLSLLLALTIAALMVLALGDPRSVGARDEGTTTILLIDVSASMGATDVPGGRLDRAREEARRSIASMGANDRMIIAQMASSAIPIGPPTSDVRALEDALAQLETVDVAADLGRAIRFALDVARDQPHPEIVVISDGRLNDPGESIAARVREAGIPVRWLPVGRGGRNVAISAFAVRRYPIDKSRAQVFAELWNPGSEAEDIELTLLGDGAPIDVSTLRIGAGERMPRVFENVTGADRTLEARIRFADRTRDALAVDDAAYARLPERRRARVVVVSGDDIYLDAALLLDEYLEVVHVTPDAFPPAGHFDVAIFDSFVPRAPYPVDTLWLNPSPTEGHEGPLEIEGVIERPFFERLLRDHPLVRFTTLRDVNIARALEVRTSPGDVVVGADARGPLLVTGTRGDHRFVALTFDPRESDLPLRIAWPLLVLNAIDQFTEERAGHLSSYRTDEPFYVPIEAGATEATLIAPGGQARRIPIAEGRAIGTGSHAGFYTVRTDRGEQVIAANLGTSQESVLAIPDSIPIAGAASQSRTERSIGVRSEPWTWLIAVAFALIAFEWIAFHRRWTV